eukprot:Hpha_TRINITY_DN16674_c1_g1::TRINITY_DN16674_c1_g1_i1::g.181527::m.181527
MASEALQMEWINASIRQKLRQITMALTDEVTQSSARKLVISKRRRELQHQLTFAAAKVAEAEGRCEALLEAAKGITERRLRASEIQNAVLLNAPHAVLQGERIQELLRMRTESVDKLRSDVGAYDAAEIREEAEHAARLAAAGEVKKQAELHSEQLRAAAEALEVVMETTKEPQSEITSHSTVAETATADLNLVVASLENRCTQLRELMEGREAEHARRSRGVFALHSSGDVHIVVEMIRHDRQQHETQLAVRRSYARELERQAEAFCKAAETAAGREQSARYRINLHQDTAANYQDGLLDSQTELQEQASEIKEELDRKKKFVQDTIIRFDPEVLAARHTQEKKGTMAGTMRAAQAVVRMQKAAFPRKSMLGSRKVTARVPSRTDSNVTTRPRLVVTDPGGVGVGVTSPSLSMSSEATWGLGQTMTSSVMQKGLNQTTSEVS